MVECVRAPQWMDGLIDSISQSKCRSGPTIFVWSTVVYKYEWIHIPELETNSWIQTKRDPTTSFGKGKNEIIDKIQTNDLVPTFDSSSSGDGWLEI